MSKRRNFLSNAFLLVAVGFTMMMGVATSRAAGTVFNERFDWEAFLSLGELDGTNGFRLDGVHAGDQSGGSVSSAGDINGDGVDDLIIGAVFEDLSAGASYVVFGRTNGFGTSFALGTLDGTTGFRLDGVNAGDLSGESVSCAGDVNGDGVDDLIIGAPDAEFSAGASYVVFGQTNGFGASLALGALDGTNGFRIDGVYADDQSGCSVSGAGDVNGDDVDDLIIGAYGARGNAGESYLVFGRTNGFDASLMLDSLDGTNGFRLAGISVKDYSGRSVSGAGDINGDGVDDLIVGAYGADPIGFYSAGESYVVFGRTNGFGASLMLDSLDGINGFRLIGNDAMDYSGFSVSDAGDVNGDDVDDLIVGAYGAGSYAGESYVVFGRTNGFGSDLLLGFLDGSTGFRIKGINWSDYSGISASGAGDVNGDGVDDLIIGASDADPNGASYGGESYVIFGRTTGFDASLMLDSLDGTNGFRLDGIDAYDYSGVSVSGAGDVNGDGLDDLIVGANYADPNGNSKAGESYVVFGQRTHLDGVTPASGSYAGGYSVAIRGVDLCNGITGDVTNVTLCGASVTSIDSESSSQIIVTAASPLTVGSGDVVIYSSSQGVTTKVDGFEYVVADQTVWFANPGPQKTTNTVSLSATASSGLSVTQISVVSGPAILTGSSVSFTNSGTVVLSAFQEGDDNWNASPITNMTFDVTKAMASVSLIGTNQVYDGSARVVTVTTVPSGRAVDMTYDGSMTAPTNVGSYAVVATVNEAMYQGGSTGILTVAKADQTVDFPNIGTQETTNIVTLVATSTSGLIVTNFSVASGPAVLNGAVLSFTGSGSVTLTAVQDGDSNWNASPVTNITFNVIKAVASVTLSGLNQVYDGTPRIVTADTVSSGQMVDITYDGSVIVPFDVGTYIVTGIINEAMYQGGTTGVLTIAGIIMYVDDDAAGLNDGSSWIHAFNDLQDALAAADRNNQIWVAAGIYYPDEASAGVAIGITDGNQNHAFQLVDGASIYGGFGAYETDLTQRDVDANVTVLSGDIDQNDVTNQYGVVTSDPGASIIGSNSYHVVRSDGTGASTILDGVTITAGKAVGGVAPQDGGCLNTYGGSLGLYNCTISGGWADYNAGGAYVSGGTVVFSNCTVMANHAARGGGVSVEDSSVTFLDSRFLANSCMYSAAGIYCYSAQATFDRCTFKGNSSSGFGGGYGADNGNVSIRFRDCLFSGNRAGNGGGLSLFTDSSELVNCTVAGNYASGKGGGIYASGGSVNLHNSIVWHNGNGDSSLPVAAASIFNTNAPTRIAYSMVEYSGSDVTWDPNIGIDDGGNTTSPPSFLLPPAYADAPTQSGDSRLRSDSPARDTGTNSFVTTVLDLDQLDRIFNTTVDKGAFEFKDSDGDGLTDGGETQYGGNPSNPDTDNDGAKDGDEVIAGTILTDSNSVFKITGVLTESSNVVLQWSSAANRTYAIWGSSNLLSDAWWLIEGGIPATWPNNEHIVVPSAAVKRAFYLIEVE